MERKKEDVLFFPRVWLYARTGSGHRSAAEPNGPIATGIV